MKIKNIIYSLATFLVVAGCSQEFLDVNENPNNPTSSTPSITLPVAQQNFVAMQARGMNYLGNFMMYNWAVPSNWSAQGDLIRYNLTNSSYSYLFNNSYSSIFSNLKYIQDYDDDNEYYSAYDVIAEAIFGTQYQYLVDLYGDVPYSEANLLIDNTTPKYDNEQEIYTSLIDRMTAAATLAMNMPEAYEDPGSQDIIFHGDMEQWASYINTVKLRMLIRLSNSGQDNYIKEEINKIDANGAGFITADVYANPGYSSSDAAKMSPLYGYMYQTSGEITDRNDYTVATDYVIDNLKLNNDPRLYSFFNEAEKGGYHGVEQNTVLPGTGYTAEELSHIGDVLVSSADQDQIVMHYSEALFLQAEAVQRGYMAGDAKALFEAGIEASFNFLKADNAADYYAQPIANINWDSSTNKISAIIYQKNIALIGTMAHEAWMEWVRTGYPTGLPTSAEGGSSRPIRLLYPSEEISRNADNVPSRAKDEVFTDAPFWR